MPLPQLTEREIQTWTLEQKDQWWLRHVWKGDMPQLTVRAALTAMFLGSFFFWLAECIWKTPGTTGHKLFLQNLEPICAGVIAGGAITGIAVILLENFVL